MLYGVVLVCELQPNNTCITPASPFTAPHNNTTPLAPTTGDTCAALACLGHSNDPYPQVLCVCERHSHSRWVVVHNCPACFPASIKVPFYQQFVCEYGKGGGHKPLGLTQWSRDGRTTSLANATPTAGAATMTPPLSINEPTKRAHQCAKLRLPPLAGTCAPLPGPGRPTIFWDTYGPREFDSNSALRI
jgi:hypothetical protein